MKDIREENRRDVAEYGEDNNKIHSLRADVYTRDKEELIKIDFSLSVPNLKGGVFLGLM